MEVETANSRGNLSISKMCLKQNVGKKPIMPRWKTHKYMLDPNSSEAR